MRDANEKVAIGQAAFRSCVTGAVVATGPYHDVTRLPGGLDADLGEWQAGFSDASGRFMDRREAADTRAVPAVETAGACDPSAVSSAG